MGIGSMPRPRIHRGDVLLKLAKYRISLVRRKSGCPTAYMRPRMRAGLNQVNYRDIDTRVPHVTDIKSALESFFHLG